MKIDSAIIHEQNPGSDPDHLAEQLSAFALPKRNIGVEMDVTLKKCCATSNNYQPVSLSRDRSLRIDLLQHLETFRSKGFYGPFYLDLIDRRASAAVIKVVSDNPDYNIIVQVPELALAYKTPKARDLNLFEVEKFWQDAWPKLTVSSRFAHIAKEFLDYGVKINLFWEPIESDQYRRELKEIVEKVDTIVYKMPHLTYSSKFDPNVCLERDLDFFNSVANDMTIAPMGSVELLRSNSSVLFSQNNPELYADGKIRIHTTPEPSDISKSA